MFVFSTACCRLKKWVCSAKHFPIMTPWHSHLHSSITISYSNIPCTAHQSFLRGNSYLRGNNVRFAFIFYRPNSNSNITLPLCAFKNKRATPNEDQENGIMRENLALSGVAIKKSLACWEYNCSHFCPKTINLRIESVMKHLLITECAPVPACPTIYSSCSVSDCGISAQARVLFFSLNSALKLRVFLQIWLQGSKSGGSGVFSLRLMEYYCSLDHFSLEYWTQTL